MRLCPQSAPRRMGATPALGTAKTRCPSTATGATQLFKETIQIEPHQSSLKLHVKKIVYWNQIINTL